MVAPRQINAGDFLTAGGLSANGGDASSTTVTTFAAGAVAREIRARYVDSVCVLDFIPINLHASILDASNTTDLRPYFVNAIETRRNIYVPQGVYYLKDVLNLKSGQKLFGANASDTILSVDAAFNMTATGIVRLQYAANTTNVRASQIDGIGIQFDQPDTNVRTNLIQYPPAIYAKDVPRFVIGHVRISRAWNGIDATGNSGGALIKFAEIGAFNKGLMVDGALDFFHADTLHFWPFGIAESVNLKSIYSDQTTIAAEIGRVDGLDIKSLTAFLTQVNFIASGSASVGRTVTNLELDGDGARVTFSGGPVTIGSLYTTKSTAALAETISAVAGDVSIGFIRQNSQFPNGSDIICRGATLLVNGGYSNVPTGNQSNYQVTSGTMSLHNIYFNMSGTSAYGQPRIKQTGGFMSVRGMRVSSSRTTGSGALISFIVDGRFNHCTDNHFSGWGYTLPTSIASGVYGPNDIPGIAFTPTVTFDTPGDFSATYTTQVGQYHPEAHGYRFEVRLVFSTNAFTTASGNAKITGLPIARGASATDSFQIPVSASMVTLGAGYSSLAALSAAGSTDLSLRQSGSGVATVALTSANIKPSTAGYELIVSGFIPTR